MLRHFNVLLAVCLVSLAVGCSDSSDGRAANRAVKTEGAPTPVIEAGAAAPGTPVLPAELVSRLGGEREFVLLDVRSREEFAAGHIPGAVNIPYDELPERLEELSGAQEREIIVYCRTGRRAGIAELALEEAGFRNVRDLDGHMVDWNSGGFPVSDPVPCC